MFRRKRKPRQKPASREIEQYTRGMLRYRRGRHAEAARLLGPLGNRPGPLGQMARYYGGMANRALGLAAMREGHYDRAEGCLRAAAQSIGDRADLGAYLARCYARNGQYDRCATELAKAAKRGGGAGAQRRLAQSQWRAGRKEEALMTLGRALRRFGDLGELHMQLGLFYAAEERYEQAAEQLRRAVEADCDSSSAHHYLGLALAAQGDVSGALRSFQRAFDLSPGDLMLARQLSLAAQAASEAGVRFVLRLPERAAAGEGEGSHMRQLARYVAAEPEMVGSLLSLPKSETDGELFAVLAEVLKTALSEHEDYADLHYQASVVYERLGDIGQATSHARRAVGINPRYVKARMHLGALCARGNNAKEAAGHLEVAIESGADWPDVHCRAAELMTQCMRIEGAKKHLLRALELKPDFARAREALALLAA